jgi:eukaryotic-like serine/threonine-protein kinase
MSDRNESEPDDNAKAKRALRAKRWRALSETLDVLMSLPAAARSAWIMEHIADAALRETALQLLNENGEFSNADLLAPRDVNADTSGAGRHELPRVGRYRLIRKLADGGMASVWLARPADAGETSVGDVALKLPRSGLLAGDTERFKREGEILARLAHPNIARLIETGTDGEGAPFMALTFVEGAPITEFAQQAKLNLRERIALFQQVLDAVQYAHSHLILHRDLKPANILVTATGEVRLLDFGVAKLISESEIDVVGGDMTMVYGRAMTPLYASPEQLAGEPLSTASDVYSLGLVLFELLTDRRARNSETGGPTAILAAVLASVPPKPSDAVTRSGDTATIAAGALRGEIDWIVGRALAVAPTDRYATVAAFAADLRRFVAAEPIEARAPTAWYRAKKFVHRNRVATTLALAAVLGISATAGVALWQRSVAVQERDAATAEVARRVRSQGFMLRLISEYMPRDKPMTSVELLDVGVANAETYFKDDPHELVAMLLRFNGRFIELGEREREAATTFKALDHAKRSGDANLIAGTNCMAAKVTARSNLADAQNYLKEGKASLARAGDPSVGIRGECWFNEIVFLIDTGDYREASRVATEAVAFFRPRPQAKAGVHFASLLNMQGRAFTVEQRFEEAESVFRELLALDRETGMQGSVGNWVTQANLLNVWLQAGDCARADAYIGETLMPLAQNDLSRIPAIALLRIAAVAVARGDGARASALLQVAEKQNLSSPPLRQSKLATALQLCTLDGGQACASRALPAFEAATRDRFQFNTREQAVSDLMNAHVHFAQAQFDAALASLERGIALAASAHGSNRAEQDGREGSMLLIQLFDLRARTRLARAETDAARADIEAAVALFEKHVRYPAERSAFYGELLVTRAEALAALGQRDAARLDAERAQRVLRAQWLPSHYGFARLRAITTVASL